MTASYLLRAVRAGAGRGAKYTGARAGDFSPSEPGTFFGKWISCWRKGIRYECRDGEGVSSAVDLGYNVEESLPALAMYSVLTNDKVVMDQTVKALRTHAEFMLPDGAMGQQLGHSELRGVELVGQPHQRRVSSGVRAARGS